MEKDNEMGRPIKLKNKEIIKYIKENEHLSSRKIVAKIKEKFGYELCFNTILSYKKRLHNLAIDSNLQIFGKCVFIDASSIEKNGNFTVMVKAEVDKSNLEDWKNILFKQKLWEIIEE